MNRNDGLAPVLAKRIVGVRTGPHGAGAIQCANSGNILKVVGLHNSQQLSHPSALELEDAQSVTAAEQLIGLGIIEG